LDAFNLACIEASTTWISCRIVGLEMDIGPTVIPSVTPCFKCFDLRAKSNRTDYDDYLRVERHLQTDRLDSGKLLVNTCIGLAALEIVKALTHFAEPATYGHLFSMNLLTLEGRRHPVLKIPRCPHCSRQSTERPTIEAWQRAPAASG
jgi:bacteriocin biosynthesis cyclodehydratase domain-containing protein